MDNDIDKITWNIIDSYVKDTKNHLVKHHLDSYNYFFSNELAPIFKEKNPITIMKNQDDKTKKFQYICRLYLGGKNGDKLYYGKPIIYDDNDRTHYMYPNEARLRNMTYGFSIHYDVDVEFEIYNDEMTELSTTDITLDKIFLGKFPIMVQSDRCILQSLSKETRFTLGECRNDPGGYFIIDGKEKVIVSQEKFADNMLYIRDKVNDLYTHSAEIRSVSEDTSKPSRTMHVRIASTSTDSESANNDNNSDIGQIVVNIPNVRKPIPLFIVMRALGVISDKEIIQYCLLDLEKNKDLVDLFIPSVHDAGLIFTQELALKYIKTFTKGKTVSHVYEILYNFFLPHIGETNLQQKAYYLGYIVYRLLKVYMKEEPPTDRDNFKYKRIELTGSLMNELFNEYYKAQNLHIYQSIDKEYYYKPGIYQKNFMELIENNYKEFFKERIVENGFKKAFKGNWGAQDHTKRAGIVQDLNRLSFNSALSHLRKLNLPLDSSAKVVGPRLCHGSQWGIIDPLDTPDGGNVGLHKHMAFMTHITSGCSAYPLILWFQENGMQNMQECSFDFLSVSTKVIINGAWCGVITKPVDIIEKFKNNRRIGVFSPFNSIQWNIKRNEILIYTDAGRPCRPLFYVDKETKTVSYDNDKVIKKLIERKFNWGQLFNGFLDKKVKSNLLKDCNIYKLSELYDKTHSENDINKNKGILDFIDTSEQEDCLISLENKDFSRTRITNVEIHPSLLLGVMGNQIVFPENNQLPRDLFSCGQSKQGVSMYHSNFQNRIDKMGVILNYGQIPLIKSRYMKYISNEEHPYGENAVVAIMCYNGYNVEDAILFNEGSINRGMFRTTYFSMYETREESTKVAGSLVNSTFSNIEDHDVAGLKPGYDYSQLDKHGMIKEHTELNDKVVLIGKTTSSVLVPDTLMDSSVTPKKGQLGFVDKSFITEEEEGFRLAKIRIREERIPAIGDKFCSRCGQKGTIGQIIPECDMPFTEDGVKPDLIVNPHALPSRMTIGQLVECLMGKACVNYGGYGDCTAFVNKGPKHEVFGELLTKQGFHNSGNEVLYNGMTGEQMETNIFIGPTYYMRLKHMVKDKINYRAKGPRTSLTRQTVQGRANDGGLRIGEMERDCLISHGINKFLQESMLVRGDEYYMAVCNKTGTIAVYNKNRNLFLSPLADGPLKYNGTLDDTMSIEQISKHGKDFSILRVPYSFKLLMHEIQTMNICMRVITDDNVDQLTNLSYSDNANLLAKDPEISLKNISMNTNRKVLSHILPSEKIQPKVEEEATEEYMPSFAEFGNEGETTPTMDVRTPDSVELNSDDMELLQGLQPLDTQPLEQFTVPSDVPQPTEDLYYPSAYSPSYAPVTPEGNPNNPPPPSPSYMPVSPVGNPNNPPPLSPSYMPVTPEGNPNNPPPLSPSYAQVSPEGNPNNPPSSVSQVVDSAIETQSQPLTSEDRVGEGAIEEIDLDAVGLDSTEKVSEIKTQDKNVIKLVANDSTIKSPLLGNIEKEETEKDSEEKEETKQIKQINTDV